MEIKKVLKTTNYCNEHLKILNLLLPVKLTDKEMQVLAVIIELGLSDSAYIKDPLNKNTRKHIKQELGITDAGLSNFILSLTKKGFIKKDPKTLKHTVISLLYPEKEIQSYQFKLLDERIQKP